MGTGTASISIYKARAVPDEHGALKPTTKLCKSLNQMLSTKTVHNICLMPWTTSLDRPRRAFHEKSDMSSIGQHR